MIHRTRYIRRCTAERMIHRPGSDAELYWHVPIQYLLWWFDEKIYILPNTPWSLSLGNRTRSAVATFTEPDELDAAIATYNLLNP